MWEPESSWQPMPGGMAPSTQGVWSARVGDQDVVVKRLVAPSDHDSGELSDPAHVGYWRRAAEVAFAGVVTSTPGVCGAPAVAVDEDVEGITLIHPRVRGGATTGLFLARALGVFAGAELPDAGWLARDQLRDRMRRVERRGGWRTLERTPVADVAEHLWSRRVSLLALLDELPQVAQHGDPVPANLPGREGERVVGIDWSTLGRGPVGADLGYFALSAREEFDPLLEAYGSGLPVGLATRDQVALGARVAAVFTVLTRADWALARVSAGEGALAGKFRHPSVAPYLRSLQRQFPQIEGLLGRVG